MGNVKENSAVTKVFGFPFWGGGESTVSFAEHARQWVFCKSCWFCFNFTSLMELGGLSLNGWDKEVAAAVVFAAAATWMRNLEEEEEEEEEMRRSRKVRHEI